MNRKALLLSILFILTLGLFLHAGIPQGDFPAIISIAKNSVANATSGYCQLFMDPTDGLWCKKSDGTNAVQTGTGGGGAAPTSNQNLRYPGAYFSVVSATTTCTQIPYSGTITAARMWSDTAGSGIIDIKTIAFSSYTGVNSGTSITASSKPTLTSALTSSNSLSGWNTTISANSVMCFVPSGMSGATWIQIQLEVAAN